MVEVGGRLEKPRQGAEELANHKRPSPDGVRVPEDKDRHHIRTYIALNGRGGEDD